MSTFEPHNRNVSFYHSGSLLFVHKIIQFHNILYNETFKKLLRVCILNWN